MNYYSGLREYLSHSSIATIQVMILVSEATWTEDLPLKDRYTLWFVLVHSAEFFWFNCGLTGDLSPHFSIITNDLAVSFGGAANCFV